MDKRPNATPIEAITSATTVEFKIGSKINKLAKSYTDANQFDEFLDSA